MSLADVRNRLHEKEREEMKFTREACAEAIGVTYQTYAKYERENRMPSDKALKLAEHFGCELNDIFL